jgi:hypothetical protein
MGSGAEAGSKMIELRNIFLISVLAKKHIDNQLFKHNTAQIQALILAQFCAKIAHFAMYKYAN